MKKSLKLNRESVRVLSQSSLTEVAGGAGSLTSPGGPGTHILTECARSEDIYCRITRTVIRDTIVDTIRDTGTVQGPIGTLNP